MHVSHSFKQRHLIIWEGWWRSWFTVQLVYNFRSCSLVFWWKEVRKNSEFTVLSMISFFNVGKSCVCVLSHFSHVWPLRPNGPSPTRLLCIRILQTRILEWVAMPYIRGSSWTRDQTCISSPALAGRFFTTEGHLGSPRSCRLNLKMSVTNCL